MIYHFIHATKKYYYSEVETNLCFQILLHVTHDPLTYFYFKIYA